LAAREGAGRWRVAEGEEARLTPGAAAPAEVWSRGFLPLRVRSPGSHRLRSAFPGTAVVLGEDTYEVVSETELPEDGLVVYRLREWPEGEVVRDRIVYGPALVQAAQRERDRARGRERARPWRFLLYPRVGLLPEEEQERLSDRLGLYAVTATFVSGLVESAVVLALLLLVARQTEEGGAILMLTLLPGLVLLVLPGLGRAFGAVFLGETAGSAPVALVLETLKALGARRDRHDRSFVPLTRKAFWDRLGPTARSSSAGCFRTSPGRDRGAYRWGATSGASSRSHRHSIAAGSSTPIGSSLSVTRRRPASPPLPLRPRRPTRRRCCRR
jgi:hypothetical protein